MKSLTFIGFWRLMSIVIMVNSLLASLIVLNNVPSSNWLSEARTIIFLPGYLFSHFTSFYFILAVLSGIVYLLGCRNKGWLLLSAVFFSALLIAVFTDSQLFSLYRFHINSMTLNLLTGGAAGDILSFSTDMWLRIVGIVGFVLLAEYALLYGIFYKQLISGKWLGSLLLILFFSVQFYHAYSNANGDTVIARQMRYVPWAQPLTMNRQLRKWGLIENVVEKPTTMTLTKGSGLNYPLHNMDCKAADPLNVVVLMSDSLRADMLTAEVMPNTFEFAKKSINFTRHWSLSNSTRFGLFSFFYGLPPTYWFDMLGEQRGAVLFDVLKGHDYQFHIDGAAKLNSPEFDRTIFSAVRENLQWGAQGQDVEKDTAVINRLLEFIQQRENNDQPFFSFAFLDAPHSYKLPYGEKPIFQPALEQVNYLELNNTYNPLPFLNLYKSSIHYNDKLLGQVFNLLEDKKLLDNTIVIVSSDHGQEFNDLKQNYWGHNSNFSSYQLRVPLLVYWPGKPPAIRDDLTSHQDIAATLLQDAMSCNNPAADYSTGQSLFADNYKTTEPLLFANWNMKAIYTGQQYYNFPAAGGMEVLDKNYSLDENAAIDSSIIKGALLSARKFLK